jgi:hypothetical protein
MITVVYTLWYCLLYLFTFTQNTTAMSCLQNWHLLRFLTPCSRKWSMTSDDFSKSQVPKTWQHNSKRYRYHRKRLDMKRIMERSLITRFVILRLIIILSFLLCMFIANGGNQTAIQCVTLLVPTLSCWWRYQVVTSWKELSSFCQYECVTIIEDDDGGGDWHTQPAVRRAEPSMALLLILALCQ